MNLWQSGSEIPKLTRRWIFPTSPNYPIRKYQVDICEECLKHNTLVCLPTGLGKTLIAAVVMYNYLMWFPTAKVVFLAPTRPLVAQQIEACYNIMGIDVDKTVHLEGTVSKQERMCLWDSKQVFFSTPQTFQNDIEEGFVDPKSVICIIVDEAHRATGRYSYSIIIAELLKKGGNFRVIGLSATPGSDVKKLQAVIKNLNISRIEARSDDDPEIMEYTHDRNIETIEVKTNVSSSAGSTKSVLEDAMKPWMHKLNVAGVLFASKPQFLNQILLSETRNKLEEYPSSDRTLVISLEILELLVECRRLLGVEDAQSALQFMNSSLVAQNTEIVKVMKSTAMKNVLSALQKSADCNGSNEKTLSKVQALKDLLSDHFGHFTGETTRVIVFAELRSVVNDIVTNLKSCSEFGIRAAAFVGQSSKLKGNGNDSSSSLGGLKQREQAKMLQDFARGDINVLVATSIAEEGLDIAEVDLIVFFDPIASPTRIVQRMGRTGRKRSGRIVMLVAITENKGKNSKHKDKDVEKIERSNDSMKLMKNLLQNPKKQLTFSVHAPKILSESEELECIFQEMDISKFNRDQIAGSRWLSSSSSSSSSSTLSSKSQTSSGISDDPKNTIAKASSILDLLLGNSKKNLIAKNNNCDIIPRKDFPALEESKSKSRSKSEKIIVHENSNKDVFSNIWVIDSDEEIEFVDDKDIAWIHRSSTLTTLNENLDHNIAFSDNRSSFSSSEDVGFDEKSCTNTWELPSFTLSVSTQSWLHNSLQNRSIMKQLSQRRFERKRFRQLIVHSMKNGIFCEKEINHCNADIDRSCDSSSHASRKTLDSDLGCSVIHQLTPCASLFHDSQSVQPDGIVNLPFATLTHNPFPMKSFDSPQNVVVKSGPAKFEVLLTDDSDSSDDDNDSVAATNVIDSSRIEVKNLASSDTLVESSDRSIFSTHSISQHMNSHTEDNSYDEDAYFQIQANIDAWLAERNHNDFSLSFSSNGQTGKSSNVFSCDLNEEIHKDKTDNNVNTDYSIANSRGNNCNDGCENICNDVGVAKYTYENSEKGDDFDDFCCVCLLRDSEVGNEIIYCDGMCGQCVHIHCYGLSVVPQESFVCESCRENLVFQGKKNSLIKCELCHRKEGMMKQSHCGAYFAHILCALFIPECTLSIKQRPNNIHEILEYNKRNPALEICGFCSNSTIAPPLICHESHCRNCCHPYCALENQFQLAIYERKNDQAISNLMSEGSDFLYCYFCDDHKTENSLNSNYELVSSVHPFVTSNITDNKKEENWWLSSPIQDKKRLNKKLVKRVASSSTLQKSNSTSLSLKKSGINSYNSNKNSNTKNIVRSSTVSKFFEIEADLSGSDPDSESSDGDDDHEDFSGRLSGDFISYTAESPECSESLSQRALLYHEIDSKHLREQSPDVLKDRRLFRQGLPMIERLMNKSDSIQAKQKGIAFDKEETRRYDDDMRKEEDVWLVDNLYDDKREPNHHFDQLKRNVINVTDERSLDFKSSMPTENDTLISSKHDVKDDVTASGAHLPRVTSKEENWWLSSPLQDKKRLNKKLVKRVASSSILQKSNSTSLSLKKSGANSKNIVRSSTVSKFFEIEADLSGSDPDSESSDGDDDHEDFSGRLSGDFISYTAESPECSESLSQRALLYHEIDSKHLREQSPDVLKDRLMNKSDSIQAKQKGIAFDKEETRRYDDDMRKEEDVWLVDNLYDDKREPNHHFDQLKRNVINVTNERSLDFKSSMPTKNDTLISSKHDVKDDDAQSSKSLFSLKESVMGVVSGSTSDLLKHCVNGNDNSLLRSNLKRGSHKRPLRFDGGVESPQKQYKKPLIALDCADRSSSDSKESNKDNKNNQESSSESSSFVASPTYRGVLDFTTTDDFFFTDEW